MMALDMYLKIPNPATKLLPLHGVRQRSVEAPLCQTQHLHGNNLDSFLFYN